MTTGSALETCPGCGLCLPASAGARHPYLGASAACWALYGQVLAREYADPAYMAVHRITVDAYAAQHPGSPESRTIQSINIHLARLYLSLEQGYHPDFAQRVIVALTRMKASLEWLEPPSSLGALTVADVAKATTPDEHTRLVTEWARSVWQAWAAHHPRVIQLAQKVVQTLS